MPRRKRQPTLIDYTVVAGTTWWAYLRHSPGPNQDIRSQRHAVERFAHERSISIARWFVDEAESGSSLTRSAFQEMTEAADLYNLQGPPPSVAGILVLEWARFGRDEVAATVFIGFFRLRGYQVVPVQDHANLPGGGLQAIFESLQHYKNAQFLRDLTANTKRGLANVVQQTVEIDGEWRTGFSAGGFPPIGYRAVHVETGRKRNGDVRINALWEPDDTPDQWGETPWIRVQRAWEMMASGNYTYREIDDSCHLYDSLNSYNDFYRRTTYLGVRMCGEIRVEAAHPAAVMKEDFDRIQRLLDGRLRPTRHPEVATSPYLLSGLFICGYCGEAIIGQTDPRWPDTRMYMCRTKKLKGQVCRLMRCPTRLLEEAVIDALRSRVLTTAFQAQLLQEINAQLWTEDNGVAEEIARAERQLATVEKKVSNVLDMVEDHGRTASLAKRLGERERERATIRALLAQLRERQAMDRPALVTPEELSATMQQLREILADPADIARARRALEELLMPRGSKLFDEAIELRYTFPVPQPSPLTGSGVVPAAGFEPAIFTLKG